MRPMIRNHLTHQPNRRSNGPARITAIHLLSDSLRRPFVLGTKHGAQKGVTRRRAQPIHGARQPATWSPECQHNGREAPQRLEVANRPEADFRLSGNLMQQCEHDRKKHQNESQPGNLQDRRCRDVDAPEMSKSNFDHRHIILFTLHSTGCRRERRGMDAP